MVGDDDADISVGNQIAANRIFANTGPAIDLGDDGIAYNAATPRQGPNDFQNFPIIVTTAGGQLEGWLGGSEPDTTFRIDVFASAGYGPGGAGEAQDYLGSLTVTTDPTGQVSFAVPFKAPDSLPILTATATDPQGNSSEVTSPLAGGFQAPSEPVRLAPGRGSLAFSPTSGDSIDLQDSTAGSSGTTWDLTLLVSAGTLTLSSTSGLTGSGDGTGTLWYGGTLSAFNVAMDGMIYAAPAGFHSNCSLSVAAWSDGITLILGQVIITTGSFVVTTTADSGPGSLRQAILDSNATTGGTNTINFNIPGSGLQTITPVSALPAITNPVLINGTSQPGYAGTPLITIEPPATGSADSLTSTGSVVTLSGVETSRFALGQENRSSTVVVQSGPVELGPGGEVVAALIDTTVAGMFAAQLHAPGLTAVLALLDSTGKVLVQSDGHSAADRDGSIDEYLPSGTYTLITELTAGAGVYSLTALLTPAATPFQPIPVGSCPSAVVAGDFNGDGRTDLAVANELENTVSVLLGNGDGTFQPQATYAVGTWPGAIVAGDFTGNGRTDLAVANQNNMGYGPGTVSVLLGNGDGTFQPQVTYAVGNDPKSIVAEDFTGNGRTDLAVANAGNNTVSVLLGNGDGTFQPQVTYAVGASPDAIVAGDFTGDGRTDLAVANWGDTPCRCCWATAMARFSPRRPTPWGMALDPSWRVSSPATAAPTSPSRTKPTTPYRCCWAMAMARSSPRSPTRWGSSQRPSWRVISTATAAPTSPSQTRLATAFRCCWAMATARSRHKSRSRRGHLGPRSWQVISPATAALTSPWPTRSMTPCRCYWATATARTSPR